MTWIDVANSALILVSCLGGIYLGMRFTVVMKGKRW